MPSTVDRQMAGGSGRFVHLHVHTEFSVLDGLGGIDEYVNKAVELGMPALAVTDHGNICGHPRFYKAARKAGLEPVLGQEFYYVDDVAWRPARGEGQPERAHFGVIAIGHRGYEVLSELSTEGHRNYYYKPVVGRSQLEQLGDDARHLVVFSGCAASAISRAVLAGDMDEARERVLWWRETFPNFYIELMHHDTDFDLQLNAGLIELAQRYSIPWVITNDPHYVVPEDACHHDTLLAIQTASDIDDPERFRFDGEGYHLRSRAELRRVFRRHYGDHIWRPGAAETLRIAKKCKVRVPAWETRKWQFPTYARAEGDAFGLLKRLAWAGLRERGLRDRPEYVERTRYELKVMKQVGIEDFMLITAWCVEQARAGGTHPELGPIPVGPGRGSVCGSLVALLLGIHKIDPIRYKLRFDRFLNPARPKMPDIDSDFGQARRMEMFDVVRDEFGEENVVHVCAYQNMKTKSAFQSLAKAHGISYPERIRISKELTDDDEHAYSLPEAIQTGYPELHAQLTRLSGVKKGISTHPAGIVIADPELQIRKMVPEMWIANTKRWVGQYDLEAVEELGLLKEDFLGLRTLDTIAEAVKLIEETTGERLDPDSWYPDHEPDDDKVYRMLGRGRTAGIFQMEGPTNQRGIQAIKPVCFEDIVSCTSLYRTGAISAGFPAIFLANRKHGRDEIPYVHETLRPILEETWGVVLYQEQVMDMAEQIAGFSGAQLADIIEAIKHKKGPLMQSMKPTFIDGCYNHSQVPKKIGLKIWKMIEGYSGYGYNRSHAVAYSFTTYQTARLKALWPHQFMAALIRTVDTSTKEGKEKRDTYMREAVALKLKVLPPCVNRGETTATLDMPLNALRMGLTDVSGVGAKAALKLIAGRPAGGYVSTDQVADAVRNSGVMGKLALVGALECLGIEPDKEQQETLLNWQFTDRMRKWRRRYGNDVILPGEHGDNEDYVCLVGEIFKITKGTTKSDPPKPYLTWKIRWSPTQAFDVRLWSETQKVWNLKEGSVVMVQGRWEGKWQNISVGRSQDIRVVRRAQ